MTALIQALIDGVLIGGVYGLMSVGLSIVFGVLGVVNFAQAEFLMLGMYVAWLAWAFLGLDPMIGALFSLAAGLGTGMLVQRQLVARVMGAPPIAQIFLTVGLMTVMENSALIAFGSDYRSVLTPYQTEALAFGPFFISVPYLMAFAAALVATTVLWVMLERSWAGRIIRATAQDGMAAAASGIDTRRVYTLAFGLGTGLTAFAGGIILPYATVSPTSGSQYAVLMFTVVVLGGLGSIAGALVGGLAAGIIQAVSALLLPLQLQNLVLFVLFILLVALRPQGLLGGAAR